VSRRRTRDSAADRAAAPCTVTVCRGCCCGSLAKHPGVDHAAQVDRLRTALGGTAQVRVSDCLDACERSNVVVVSPSTAGRGAGARPTWLGFVLDDDAIVDVAAWVRAGGPGMADQPATLDLYTFNPPRRVRQAAER
jgi:(2Fe-2S) ferredoxin